MGKVRVPTDPPSTNACGNGRPKREKIVKLTHGGVMDWIRKYANLKTCFIFCGEIKAIISTYNYKSTNYHTVVFRKTNAIFHFLFHQGFTLDFFI